jgi:hypothetical protein
MTPDERLNVICGAAAAVVRAIWVALAFVLAVVALLLLAELCRVDAAAAAAPAGRAVPR